MPSVAAIVLLNKFPTKTKRALGVLALTRTKKINKVSRKQKLLNSQVTATNDVLCFSSKNIVFGWFVCSVQWDQNHKQFSTKCHSQKNGEKTKM